jgi:hypothetical protein
VLQLSFAALGVLLAQLSPDLELLTHVKLHEIEQLHRQPNYTCTETVERSQRSSATRKFQLLDTLRLEVALVGGKELFAWPGAKKFSDVEISDMIQRGAIGNGSFALHARAVFEGRAATYKYRGAEHLEGTPADTQAERFDFDVPLFLSGYSIKTNGRKAIVAYHGSFWADPRSFDLIRMEVIADQIPEELGLAKATDRVDYKRLKIGDNNFLLPSASELHMADLNGAENRNIVHFSACRQYSGESVISFAEPEPEAGNSSEPQPAREVELPPGAAVTVELADAIEMDAAAIGDPVEARVKGDVKSKGVVLIPKGATAKGRITTLERHTEYTALGLTFTDIEAQGVHAPITLSLDDVIGIPKPSMRARNIRAIAARIGEGILYLTSQTKLARGTLLYWRNAQEKPKRDSSFK